jgi:hypothetical protein
MLLRGRAGSRRSLHMPWVEVVRVRVRVRVRVFEEAFSRHAA